MPQQTTSKETGTLDRRTFFYNGYRWSLLAIGSGIALPGCSRDDTASINDALSPKIDRNIASVQIQVAVENPHKVLIVINEVHYREEVLDSVKRRQVDAFQVKVEQVILALQEQFGIREVFKDGMDPKIAKGIPKGLQQIREALSDSIYSIPFRDRGARQAIIAELKYAGSEEERAFGASLIYATDLYDSLAHDACLRLAFAGRIKLLPGEDTTLNRESTRIEETVPDAITNPQYLTLVKRREELVIQSALSAEGLYQVFVFGHFHDFEEEALAHNQANPEKPIMLIEITPTGQEKFVRSL